MSQELDLLAFMTPESAYVAASGDLVLTSGGGTNTITPSRGVKVWTIEVCTSAAVIFYIRNGTTNMALNSGAALTADALHTFTFVAQPNVAFSFRFSGNATIRLFTVTEGRS